MATRWKPPKIEVTDIDLFRAKVILTSEATRDLFNGIIDYMSKPDDELSRKCSIHSRSRWRISLQ